VNKRLINSTWLPHPRIRPAVARKNAMARKKGAEPDGKRKRQAEKERTSVPRRVGIGARSWFGGGPAG
jgi:hypothetical protein